MKPGASDGLRSARVRLACGRIAAGATAILEAYRLGVPEGPHERPWTSSYHCEAVRVYAQSLPWSYQRDIGELFLDSAEALTDWLIPAGLAEEWYIVTEYLRQAGAAIENWRDSAGSSDQFPEPAERSELAGPPPRVIHYDALARLTTREGVRQLERASVAVRQHLETPDLVVLEDHERHLLKRLSSGASIVDIAAAVGYSERSVYRMLSKLWRKMGVPNRYDGLRRASSEGLLE